MKYYCLYHRVDQDGVVSACVVKKYVEGFSGNVEFFGWTYGDPIPNFKNHSFDILVLVDLSFPPDVMQWIKKNCKCIWIDHHKTAIDLSVKYEYSDMEGIRVDGKAACRLCYEYFFDKKVPKFVKLIARYDVWDHSAGDWDTSVVPLQLALKAKYGISLKDLYPDFSDLCDPENSAPIKSLIDVGKIILDYEQKQFKSATNSYAFPVLVAGKYRGICMLTNNFGSRIFESVKDNYDVYVTANRRTDERGNPVYALGLYSDPGRIDFNLGQYLQNKYGPENAGGHATSCGARIPEEDFIKLFKEGII